MTDQTVVGYRLSAEIVWGACLRLGILFEKTLEEVKSLMICDQASERYRLVESRRNLVILVYSVSLRNDLADIT